MKLTFRSEYALLALVYLSRHNADGFVSVETIADAQDIPRKFLEQILLALKRAKYLRSCKGQHGGYRLAKAAKRTVLERHSLRRYAEELMGIYDGVLAGPDRGA